MHPSSFRHGLLAIAFFLSAHPASTLASGTHAGSHGHSAANPMGEPGKPDQVSRTVEVAMYDNYYEPEALRFAAGETVRIVVRNKGQLVHELNIGTAQMHAEHQKEMQVMQDHGALLPDRIDHERMKMDMGGGHTMEHDDPNSVLLEPGKSAEIVWRFTRAGEFEFACNVPGHYAAGMVGTVQVH